MTREQYRSQRLQGYQNYANISKALRERYTSLAEFQRAGVLPAMPPQAAPHSSCQGLSSCCAGPAHSAPARFDDPSVEERRACAEIPACTHVEHNAQLYPFHHNYKCLHTAIAHFQLRNLVWATSSHDVYAVHDNCVKHTNVLREHTRTVIDMSGATPASVRSVHVATMCVGHGFVVAGAPPTLRPAHALHVGWHPPAATSRCVAVAWCSSDARGCEYTRHRDQPHTDASPPRPPQAAS